MTICSPCMAIFLSQVIFSTSLVRSKNQQIAKESCRKISFLLILNYPFSHITLPAVSHALGLIFLLMCLQLLQENKSRYISPSWTGFANVPSQLPLSTPFFSFSSKLITMFKYVYYYCCKTLFIFFCYFLTGGT